MLAARWQWSVERCASSFDRRLARGSARGVDATWAMRRQCIIRDLVIRTLVIRTLVVTKTSARVSPGDLLDLSVHIDDGALRAQGDDLDRGVHELLQQFTVHLEHGVPVR